MSQKKWKFNIIDLIVAAVIVMVVVLLAVKLGTRGEDSQVTYAGIRYTVIVENQPVEVYEGVKQHVPGALMASGARYDDQKIVSVEAEPTLVCSNGQWVEDPDHVDIIFTVEGSVEVTPVMTTTVGSQEIRVGREIILKTEYIEFDPAVVASVEIITQSQELGTAN